MSFHLLPEDLIAIRQRTARIAAILADLTDELDQTSGRVQFVRPEFATAMMRAWPLLDVAAGLLRDAASECEPPPAKSYAAMNREQRALWVHPQTEAMLDLCGRTAE